MQRADPAPATRPRPAVRLTLWGLSVALIIAVVVAVVALLGWDRAIERADERSALMWAAQAKVDDLPRLQQQVETLTAQLEDARRREQELERQAEQARAAAARVELQRAEAKPTDLVTANAVAAAEQRATAAERALTEAQARVQALEQAARVAGQARRPGALTRALNDDVAGLPNSGLPAGATARDYLVAAHQALRAGEVGRAQAALERAETRLLNRNSLAVASTGEARRNGILQIDEALDQLTGDDIAGALDRVERLLTRTDLP